MNEISASFKKLLARVELAILANGGGDYDEKACECDPDVNQSPCRYCAIRDALNETLRWLKGTLEHQAQSPSTSPAGSPTCDMVTCHQPATCEMRVDDEWLPLCDKHRDMELHRLKPLVRPLLAQSI